MIAPERQLTQIFLTLPFRHQIAVAMALDVLTDDDRAFEFDDPIAVRRLASFCIMRFPKYGGHYYNSNVRRRTKV